MKKILTLIFLFSLNGCINSSPCLAQCVPDLITVKVSDIIGTDGVPTGAQQIVASSTTPVYAAIFLNGYPLAGISFGGKFVWQYDFDWGAGCFFPCNSNVIVEVRVYPQYPSLLNACSYYTTYYLKCDIHPHGNSHHSK